MHVDHLSLPPPQRETLLSGPQRKFCEGVVAGLNQTEAYQAAYPRASYDTARSKSCVLAAKDDIQTEIQRLRAKADAMAGSAVLTLVEKRKVLAAIVRAQAGLSAQGIEVRASDIVSAIKADNDLAGDGSEAGANDEITAMLARVCANR